MSSTQELLSKIAAIRGRLDRVAADEDEPRARASAPPARLTFRAAQLLRDARSTLNELKSIADDSAADDNAVVPSLQREAAGMLDVVLRSLASLPESAVAQLRQCEGLQACLAAARDKVAQLHIALDIDRRDDQQVELLATLLRRLAVGESIDVDPFLRCAEAVADDALLGRPIRFHSKPKGDVARFAAHHGLTVARVQASIWRGEIAHRQRLAESLVAALVHDVGMLSVPSEIVFKPGPLHADERDQVRGHLARGKDAVARLFPGGGRAVDAVGDHHERLDGSGALGKHAEELDEPARFLAVCDMYAALASPRPYRPAHDPRTALADTLMLADQGKLDRLQAEKLLRLTFYPAGSVVQLSDGGVALVVGAPRSVVNPAKAIVIPLRQRDGSTPAFPWPVDLSESNSVNILRGLTGAERVQILSRTHPALV